MRLPFQGKITLDQTIALQTPLGDFPFSGRYEQTIDEIRELGLDVPSSIVSPTLGIEFHYRLAAGAGIFVNALAGQGTVYSGGIFFAF